MAIVGTKLGAYMTHAELKHIEKLVDNYEYILELGDPTLFSDLDEDEMKVVKQILEEKINE